MKRSSAGKNRPATFWIAASASAGSADRPSRLRCDKGGNISRKRVITAIVIACVAALAAVAVPAIRWRVLVVALKAVGQLDGVDWSELPYVLQPRAGVELSKLAYYRNPYLVIRDPLTSPSDWKRGQAQFAAHCARCHGDSARGGAGPALVDRAFIHGDSDWAIFRTIRRGVAGTAMPPAPLGRDDVWRVIAFIHELSNEARVAASRTAGDASSAQPPTAATPQMLRVAGESIGGWPLPSGSYSGQRFSRDTQINVDNVARLSVSWIYQFGTADARIESTPIVVGRRLYVTLPDGTVTALDSSTGARIWEYRRAPPADVKLCCVTANRGVAVLGTRIYVGTLDAHLLALDAATGRLVWDRTVADYHAGYSINSAPLAVANMVVTGTAGGDFPTRGFINAYDADTGALRWRFDTIPGPGQAGHETWGSGDAWRTGGVNAWGTGSYDPDLGLIYWGTGNAAPDFNAMSRPGDNLYSSSMLALDAATGRLVWHFQFSPGDDHDFDSNQTPALIDTPGSEKLLAVANRNGFFYVLDRQTGKFIRGAPFAKQTWARGLSATGRPIRLPGTSPTPRGVLLYPSDWGATNWWPAAYSPVTDLYYVDVLERGGLYFSSSSPPTPRAGKSFEGSGGRGVSNDIPYNAVRAIDLRTATVRWEHRNSRFSDRPRGGLLATAGGLVFGSDTSRIFALDAATGAVLWSFDTGGEICAPPISYRQGDRQYIVVAAGQVLMSFALPEIR